MEKYHFKEAFYAGIAGGILLLVIQMLILPMFFSVDAWEFPNVMASTLLNTITAPDIAVLLVGILVPVILTILLSLTMGWVPSTWHPWALVPVGLTFGTIVYIIYFLYFASINRELIAGLSLWHYLAFVVYGIVISVIYHTQVRTNFKPDNPLYRGYASE